MKISFFPLLPFLQTQRVARCTGFVALVALTALALGACKKHEAADARIEDPLVRLVSTQPTGAFVRGFTGVVSARIQSDIGFRVSGKVIVRLVDKGVCVKAGQPLMRLD